MNRFLRTIFCLVIVAMGSAAVLQLFFPFLMGQHSEYGVAVGWHREIAFWNMAILSILIGVLLKYDPFFLKIVLTSLIIGGLGFGTNHLMGFLNDFSKVTSLIGALENYGLVVCWLIGWSIEQRKEAFHTKREAPH